MGSDTLWSLLGAVYSVDLLPAYGPECLGWEIGVLEFHSLMNLLRTCEGQYHVEESRHRDCISCA